MKNRNNINHDDWETPEWLYRELDAEFHFDFDPCPLFSKTDNAHISAKWGKCNFINPPYSRQLKEKFIIKAAYEAGLGNLCVMLLPVSTSTKIFHEIIYKKAEIRFIKGRVAFRGVNSMGEYVTTKKPMHDSMIVIFDGRNNVS
jgi:hypothetical protein